MFGKTIFFQLFIKQSRFYCTSHEVRVRFAPSPTGNKTKNILICLVKLSVTRLSESVVGFILNRR